MKLDKLTTEQEELMLKVKDEWIKRALYDGDTIDIIAATKGIDWLYQKSGLKKPLIIFLDSPLAVQYGTTLAKELLTKVGSKKSWDQVRDQVEGQVRDQVEDQVWDQVRDQVGVQVGGQVRDQVRGQVWGQVEGQVRGQVGGQVWVQVGGQVRGQVWGQVEGQVRGQVGVQVRGQVGVQVEGQVRGQKIPYYEPSYDNLAWQSGWVAFYDFFERIGILEHADFKKYKDMLKSGIFYGVFLDGLAVVCGRSNFLARDPEHNLHNDHRSAISWRDGYELFYLQGEAFNKELWTKITSQTITAKEVMQIEDSDQRTIAISMLKPQELLKQLKAKLIDTGSEGTKLYECKNFMDTGKTEYCMHMKDHSTPREFIEFVPPEIGKLGNAVHAQATAFGIPDEDYLLIKERG